MNSKRKRSESCASDTHKKTRREEAGRTWIYSRWCKSKTLCYRLIDTQADIKVALQRQKSIASRWIYPSEMIIRNTSACSYSRSWGSCTFSLGFVIGSIVIASVNLADTACSLFWDYISSTQLRPTLSRRDRRCMSQWWPFSPLSYVALGLVHWQVWPHQESCSGGRATLQKAGKC